MSASATISARPFLKWVGGKAQLLDQLRPLLPKELIGGGIRRYFEPFVGGGALLFDILRRYPPPHVVISDQNPDLIDCYRALQQDAAEVIEHLRPWQSAYEQRDLAGRKVLYYQARSEFNRGPDRSGRLAVRAAQLIFLNKTCFNGLYRVNHRGEFNTPSGAWRSHTPTILDPDNLLAAGEALRAVRIECRPYDWIAAEAAAGDFVYFDPPYRPLTRSASFESYTPGGFGDVQQRQLGELFRKLAGTGVLLMLSNSDPMSLNPPDPFFDDLYRGFAVHRVSAARMVNSRASARGKISEIVVTSY